MSQQTEIIELWLELQELCESIGWEAKLTDEADSRICLSPNFGGMHALFTYSVVEALGFVKGFVSCAKCLKSKQFELADFNT